LLACGAPHSFSPVNLRAGLTISVGQMPSDPDVWLCFCPPSFLSAHLPARPLPQVRRPCVVRAIAAFVFPILPSVIPATSLALPSLPLSSHPHSPCPLARSMLHVPCVSAFDRFCLFRLAPALVVLASRVARAFVLFPNWVRVWTLLIRCASWSSRTDIRRTASICNEAPFFPSDRRTRH